MRIAVIRHRRPRRSIGRTWTLAYSLVILVAMALLGFFVVHRTERLALRDSEEMLELETGRIAHWMQENGPENLDAALAASLAAADPDLKLSVQVFDAEGRLIAARGGPPLIGLPLAAAVRDGGADQAFREIRTRKKYPYWVETSRMEGGSYVQVGMYARSFIRRARRIRYAFFAVAPLSILAAVAAGFALARTSLRPVATILNSMRRVHAGHFEERVALRGTGDEFDQIAESFNAALDRVQAGMDALTNFSLNAAHALRTPLTSLRGRIEVALQAGPREAVPREVVKDLLQDVTRLVEMVDAMLALARTTAGVRESQRERVDLEGLVHGVVEFFEPLAAEEGLALEGEGRIPGGLVVLGDPAWLRQLAVNLVENAIRYTPRGGRVAVALRRSDGDALLEVRDSGPGIPAAELERVFERFHRVQAGSANLGAGLGLALAREIAAVHGGALWAESEPAKGSVFTVRLPLAPEPAPSEPEA